MLRKAITKIFTTVTALFMVGLFIGQPLAFATPYGSGGYGACNYSQGCSSTTTSPSGTTSSPAPASQAPTQSGSTVLLNDFTDFFSAGGKELTLSVNQVVYFDITVNGQTQRYSVTINAIGPNYIDITVASPPINDRLYVGDTKQYDVNGDGQKDIQITLNSISTSGQADVTFKALNQAPKPAPATTAPVAKAKTHNWLWLIVFGVIALIGIIWLIILIIRRRKNALMHF